MAQSKLGETQQKIIFVTATNPSCWQIVVLGNMWNTTHMCCCAHQSKNPSGKPLIGWVGLWAEKQKCLSKMVRTWTVLWTSRLVEESIRRPMHTVTPLTPFSVVHWKVLTPFHKKRTGDFWQKGEQACRKNIVAKIIIESQRPWKDALEKATTFLFTLHSHQGKKVFWVTEFGFHQLSCFAWDKCAMCNLRHAQKLPQICQLQWRPELMVAELKRWTQKCNSAQTKTFSLGFMWGEPLGIFDASHVCISTSVKWPQVAPSFPVTLHHNCWKLHHCQWWEWMFLVLHSQERLGPKVTESWCQRFCSMAHMLSPLRQNWNPNWSKIVAVAVAVAVTHTLAWTPVSAMKYCHFMSHWCQAELSFLFLIWHHICNPPWSSLSLWVGMVRLGQSLVCSVRPITLSGNFDLDKPEPPQPLAALWWFVIDLGWSDSLANSGTNLLKAFCVKVLSQFQWRAFLRNSILHLDPLLDLSPHFPLQTNDLILFSTTPIC